MMFANNFIAPTQLEQGAATLVVDLPDGVYRLTLADSATAAGRWEIVDAEVQAGVAKLARGLEGTADQDWPPGSVVYCTITAGVLNNMLTRLASVEQLVQDMQLRLLPPGGDPGALLRKASDADYDTEWFLPDDGSHWAILASDSLLAYTGDGPAVNIWGPNDGSIQRLSASPDGSRLAISMSDGTTLLLDASGVSPLSLPAAGMSFSVPAWRGNDIVAVERGDTHAIQIYSISQEQVLQAIDLPAYSGKAWEVSGMAFVGDYFCASTWAGGDATMYAYDEMGSLEITRTGPGGVFTQFLVAQGLLFAVSETGPMSCFDPADGFASVTPPFFAEQEGVKWLAISPDGRYMAVAVDQWQLSSKLNIWDFDQGDWVSIAPVTAQILAGQMAWSRDGARLYVTPNDGPAFYITPSDWTATSLGVSAYRIDTMHLEAPSWGDASPSEPEEQPVS